MPVRQYCRFNSFCTLASCKSDHHRPINERQLLLNIINDTPEIATMKEEIDSNRNCPCAHGLRCFEKECGFFHGINHDGRKILTKKFNKQFKAIQMKEKIKKEIEEIGKYGMPNWDE
jgi:hypothetical protein